MSEIYFLKGSDDKLDKSKPENEQLEIIKNELTKVFDTKSLSFLIGSGCSSLKDESSNEDIGIPTMKPLAQEFFNSTDNINSLSVEEKKFLKEDCCINIDLDEYKFNLEKFLESIQSLNFYSSKTKFPERSKDTTEVIDKYIDIINQKLPGILLKTKLFILEKCLNEKNKEKDYNLIKIYESFYRKLLYRNSNLPKPNIFTTNYDLYSEQALDNLGIHYFNGFSGGINKYFNPTIFNFALAERMDLSQNKWNVIDNFIYLYKIHGSVNWMEDKSANNKIFKIREIQNPTFETLKDKETLMIYPTPIKQNSSLGTPYSDLFREFQKKIMQNNNVLVSIGYSFGDEHINNLIFQAFTIPSFRLIIFIDKDIEYSKKILDLNDPRIWLIGGKMDNGNKLHYFQNIVTLLLPDSSNEEIDTKIENAIKNLLNK
jgi:hypothetical protein